MMQRAVWTMVSATCSFGHAKLVCCIGKRHSRCRVRSHLDDMICKYLLWYVDCLFVQLFVYLVHLSL